MASRGARPRARRSPRPGLTLIRRRARLAAGPRDAPVTPLEFAIGGQRLVGRIEAELHVVGRPQHLAAWKGDANVVHRVGGLTEESVVEAEVANAVRGGDEGWIEREGGSVLRGDEQVCRPQLSFETWLVRAGEPGHLSARRAALSVITRRQRERLVPDTSQRLAEVGVGL